jgi:hypothetical protein
MMSSKDVETNFKLLPLAGLVILQVNENTNMPDRLASAPTEIRFMGHPLTISRYM